MDRSRRRRRPAEGSIEHWLRSLYPADRRIYKVTKALEKVGLVALSDLERVRSDAIEGFVPKLFLVALREYLHDRVTHIVTYEMIGKDMVLGCTEKVATLRAENQIPQLEETYNPMFQGPELDKEVVEGFDAEEVDLDDDDITEDDDDVTEDNESEECHEDVPAVVEVKESIQLTLYEFFEGHQLLTSVWPKGNPAVLLQRKDYPKILEKVKRMWEKGAKAVMLTGTPGAGKTGFLLFTLLCLLKEYKAVLLRTKNGKYCFFQPPPRTEGEGAASGGVPVGYRCYLVQNEWALLLEPSIYFLVDGKLRDPPGFSCNALLACNPLQDNFKEYQKDGRHDSLHLPVWSAAEIALAWQEIFDPKLNVSKAATDEEEEEDLECDVSSDGSADAEEHGVSGKLEQGSTSKGHSSSATREQEDVGKLLSAKAALTLDVVKERYRKWGGTPRFVLERPDRDLDKTINSVKSIQTTVEAMGKEIADADHPSHKITHMKVRPGYDTYEYMFASPYVMEKAREKLKADTGANLRLFLSYEGMQSHALNGLKENIFQAEFADIAVGRKHMKVRQVFSDIKKKGRETCKLFDFRKTFHGVFHLKDYPATALPANRIIWPGSKIEAAFDSLKIVGRKDKEDILELYQVTVSSGRNEHGLKYDAVERVMQQLNIGPSRTRVYIATTSGLYPKAGYQKWMGPGDRVLTDVAKLQQLAPIAQYALDTGI